MKRNTSWTTPKRNFLAGVNDLRKALAAGYNARLIREWNEKCDYPIRISNFAKDFKSYKFNYGTLSTRNEIINNTSMNDNEKYITLNYINVFGTKEAKEKYYKTGKLSKDNFKSGGVSHLVNVKDAIDFHQKIGDFEYAKILEIKYISGDPNTKHFYDFYSQTTSIWTAKKFKRKVWVVELIDEGSPNYTFLTKLLTILVYPTKFIPQKDVLDMDDYKLVTFRIGDVKNGFSVEFHLPKKFSFN